MVTSSTSFRSNAGDLLQAGANVQVLSNLVNDLVVIEDNNPSGVQPVGREMSQSARCLNAFGGIHQNLRR